jgi:HEAT repeat protein
MPYSTRRILRPLLGWVLLTFPFTVAAQTDWVSQAIQLLQSEDPDIRLSAVRELSRLADARAVEPLIRTLNDRDAGVKAATITALGWIKDTRGTDPIITMLNDNDPAIVCLAAQALAMIGDTRAVNPLIFFLQSRNLSVKFAAVEALGKLKDPRAVEPLSVLLRDHDGLQKKAQDALIEMGPIAVEHLCLLLQADDHVLRFYAADLLTKIHDVRAIKPLISVLGVRENAVGQLAADGLVGIGVSAVDELMFSLSNPNPIVRQLAIKALGQIKDRRAFFALLDALDDQILDVRRQALVAIMNFEGDLVTDAALTALQDPGLRVEASLLLGERKDVRALPYLIETLRGSDPFAAERAHRVLVLIGKPGVEELIRIVRDRNLDYPMREIRQTLEQSKQQFLFRCGNEPRPPILDPRRLAAIALGEIGDRRAIAALTEALKDESPGLRADAAKAVANIEATGVEP